MVVKRVALVLGSGGMAGGAFHAGVLKALHDVGGIDPRQTDIIVGTSAGALTGALIGAGVSADDVFRRETGKPLSAEGAATITAARKRIGARERPTAGMGGPAAPEIATHFAFQPWRVAPGAVAAGLLPRGDVSTDPIAALVDGLYDDGSALGAWPNRPELKVVTVSLSTGRRVIFGSDSETPLGAAVAASCSVPGVFAPVTIEGTEYFDGGVHSSDNVDVLARHDADVVIVSSPMSIQNYLDRPGPWSGFRAATRMQTDIECGRLPHQPAIVVIRPGREDLDAMGTNFLDPKRRPTVAMQAFTTASDFLRTNPLKSTHSD